MKLTTRDITILKVFGIVLVSALLVLAMFYPEYINNPHSIKEIENKQEEVSNLNNTLSSNESIIQSESSSLERLRDETLSLETEYNQLDRGLVNTEFDLHIPSILITLEQEAHNSDLEIKIDYESIKTYAGNESNDQEFEDERRRPENNPERRNEGEGYPEDEFENPEEGLGQGGDELSEESTLENLENDIHMDDMSKELGSESGSTLSNAHEEITEDIIRVNIPTIEGVSVTTVKINLNGTYENMRNFILSIDEIDFIEHNAIDLLSYGDTLSGAIVLNIFHTEEGGGGHY